MQTVNYTSGIRPDGTAVISGKDANGAPMILKIETVLNVCELHRHLDWIISTWRELPNKSNG